VKLLLEKLLSGRWILTIACAIVFIYCSTTGIFSGEAIISVIMFVIQSYFNKDRKIKSEESTI